MPLIIRKSELVKKMWTFHWDIENFSVYDLIKGEDCPIKSPSFKCGNAPFHLELFLVPGEIHVRVVQSGDDSSWCIQYAIELLPKEVFDGCKETRITPIKLSSIAHAFPTKQVKNSVLYREMTVRLLLTTATLEHCTNAQSDAEPNASTASSVFLFGKAITSASGFISSPASSTNNSLLKYPWKSEQTVKTSMHGEDKFLKQGSVTLSKNFEHLLKNSSFSDVTLKVGEDTFQAHKNVLACRSKVFAAMFESGMKEGLENEVNLVEMKSETAKEMLQYIYTGKIEELSMERALDLYVAADRYDLSELKGWCKDFILKYISAGDVCKVAILADLHTDGELAEAVKRVFKERSKLVLAMKGWRDFAQDYPRVYGNLVESAL